MNRNILKWVLIAVVILGAAGYLILSETSSNSKKEQIAVGHSKAFTIEPIDGITISAAENALDKNRKFKITPASDKEWKKTTKKVEEVAPEHLPVLCFDLDAGMKPDEVMPGYFQVAIDLDKLGIPESLYDKLSVWRDGGDEVYEYVTWVENGKLCFNSDQNSFIEVVVAVFAVGVPLVYTVETIAKHMAVGGMYKGFFFAQDDLVIHQVKDRYGNFQLCFRYKDTEWASRFESFQNNSAAYKIEFAKVKQQADEIYNRRVDKLYKKELGDMNFWQKLVGSTAAYNRAKEAVNHAFLIDSIGKQNPDLQRYEKALELPPSIKDIEHFLKISSRYLTFDQDMKPQTKNLEVDLIDKEHAGESNAEFRNGGTKFSYMFVNYDIIWTGNPQKEYVRKGWPENVLLSINHELFHSRQKITKWMDFRSEETTAVYNEMAAAHYFFTEKEMVTDLLSKDPAVKAYISTHFQLSGRDKYASFGFDFNANTFTAEVAYTYAEFMDYLQLKTKGSETAFLKGGHLLDKYGYSKSHAKNYMDWFGIKDEKVFNGYLRDFCMLHAYEIWNKQNSQWAEKAVKTQELEIKKNKPFVNVTTGNGGLVMRTVNITCEDNKNPNFNAFVLRDNKTTADDLAFIGSWDCFTRTKTGAYTTSTVKGDCFQGNKNEYQIGFFKVPKESSKFTVVAYFQPDAPRIRRVRDDVLTLIIPKPVKALRRNRYITGAEVTYTDKNGNKEYCVVMPEDFGEKVKWNIPGCSGKNNAFSLSYHWFYDLDEQQSCISPESEPAQWGAKGDEPEEEVVQTKEPEEEVVQTKEPETNYWKQVSSRMIMKNTSIDVDESNDDEVSSDYRSIDLQAAKTGRSLEFTGMGATEEKTKENGRVYVQDIFIEGTLTYTEPPKFWIPTQQYKAHWEIADDPYLTKVSDPFVFEAKNTSSDQAACAQSKKDKIDNGRSSVGKVNWLRGSTTTFEARHPEKNGPKSFTLTQTYSIKERQGSDLMATVTFVYNYEWVGEEEPEPELETENVPEGGYWKLVRTKVDDSNASGKTSDPSLQEGGNIKGEKGTYTAHGERIDKDYPFSYDRVIRFEKPKNIYLPGEKIELEITNEAFTVRGNGTPNKFPYGKILIYNQKRAAQIGRHFYDENPRYETGVIVWKYGNAEAPQPGYETKTGDPGFYIQEEVESQYCTKKTIYYYEWVEDGKTAESVKDEPSQEDQENFLDITEIQFYCHTNEPYGKGVVYTTYDHQGVSYKFKKTGSSSTFNGRDYDSEDVFTTTRSGDYQIVTAKFRQNKFDGSKANVDGYRSGGNKTCVDEEFTLTLKIAKDRSVEGTFSGTRKTLAGAGSWPEVASTCNMSISGSFGPEKIKDNDYSHDFTTINSFSYSVGGFQAYFKRADGTMPTNVDNTREFKFSTTSTNARICLSIFGTK